MGKTFRTDKDIEYDEEQENRILDKIRKPVPPPGKFHTPNKRGALSHSDRKRERKVLHELMKEYNNER